MEKHPQKIPPVLQYDVPDPLRRFIALPPDTLLVLGARRNPPIPSPHANSNTQVSLLTSVGFTSVTSEFYAAATTKLQPDIVVGLPDIPFGQDTVSLKRKDKMSDRTGTWLRDLIVKKGTLEDKDKNWAIFAPILPIELDLQSWYLEHVIDEMVDKINGVAIYDAYLLDNLPDQLQHLPRLSFHAPASPHEILRHVSLGMDIFTVPFVNDATDAGIVLDFTFPPPLNTDGSTEHSMGIDMWSGDHALSVSPLSEGCTCYACTKHHRAFLHHLLAAKEMLGWALIQIHNHAVISAFFAGVRASIEDDLFDTHMAAFEVYYESTLPEKTGQGPRVRGYQFKSESHAKKEKKNPKAFKKFSEDEILKLRAAHGQRPNKNPEIRDYIDDEALVGLLGLENSAVDPDPVKQIDGLIIEDDKRD